ncbi:hypothetical protein NC653_019736 [Populus alba x Populus x berolinensis]|uniref:DUF4283 domain-containing protein n=1 Tax=Populus alba x Populus x berolinensis TaxID=444605 RepID=A0AAD6QJM6_9ROSI|nr:hypothetical protein NC653_019736 [Populus alba x Populus x berolinensis]
MAKNPTNGYRPQTAATSSWANRVRVSDSSTRFTLEPIPRQPIGHRLVISEEVLMDNAAQWNRCMVGFFPGFRMPYHAVNTIASRVWRQCGLENVTTTSNGFMIFRFTTEEEMHAVLEKGPWMFGGKNIVLQQWHPRFKFDKNKISTLPVWIRLHGLPFPLWSKQGLSMAASMVGRPLSCDESTYNCIRLDYARVCVEVDASLPFVHEFDIESPLTSEPITVKVDYEWKPSRCEKCMTFGHSCPTATTLQKGKMLATETNSVTIPTLPNIIPPTGPSTSSQIPIPPTDTLIPATIQTLPPNLSIPTINLPPATIDVIAPLPSMLLPSLKVPQSLPILNANDQSADTNPIDGVPLAYQPQLKPMLDTTICLESKMDSLHSTSEASSAVEASTAETSTAPLLFNESHDDSPNPSPKTVRKRKGGKKRKEARGLQWL